MRVAIISDNYFLVSSIFKIIECESYKKINFDFFYSSINKNPDSLIKLGMKSINVKESNEKLLNCFDVIISAHCKQIFPKELVSSVRCINIHPGLNPYNRGWFPQVFSIINKLPAGITIHEMDEEVDHGDIIFQKEVNISSVDTSIDVYNKIQDLEVKYLDENLLNLVLGNYELSKPGFEGNYNGINDFKELCKLDLSDVDSFENHLNKLRALSHGDFKNGYFFDSDGNKVYVKVELSYD